MTDTCPRCLAERIPPARTRRDGDQIVTGYRCRCGHRWTTSRLTAAYRPAA